MKKKISLDYLREHYICHLLLTKFYTKDNHILYYKTIRAFMMMCWAKSSNHKRYLVSSKKYEKLKEQFSKIMSESQRGKNNSQNNTQWICNLELEINKKVPKDIEIPDGWQKGRIRDFKKFKEKPEEDNEKKKKE